MEKGKSNRFKFLDFLIPILGSIVIVTGDWFWDRREAKKKKVEN